MARLPRITLVGFPHHLVQRGYKDQAVFEMDDDYRRYLDWLQLYTGRYGVDIWAYCLMPNHVHFICVPRAENALAQAFNALHMRYAQNFNGKRNRRGHVWRPRFMSCVLDESSVREEIRFVENNPVRQGLALKAWDYPWSSAAAHVFENIETAIGNELGLEIRRHGWQGFLEKEGDQRVVSHVRSGLRTGRPVGDREFIHRLEQMIGKPLKARPRGRPRILKAYQNASDH